MHLLGTDWSRRFRNTISFESASTHLISQYVRPTIVGLLSGGLGAVIGAAMAAKATLRNGDNQRSHEQRLTQQQLAADRQAVKLEVEAKLRELADI